MSPLPGFQFPLFAALLALALCATGAARSADERPPLASNHCPQTIASGFPGSEEELRYRCELVTGLKRRGLSFPGPTADLVLKELTRPYSSTLELDGKIPISRPAVDYLFRELPDTAKLINHFEGTRYDVYYTTPMRTRFFGTNNRSMWADFDIVEAETYVDNSTYLLFESGWAKLLFWQFRGNTIVDIGLTEAGGKTHYQVTVHIFTDSRGYKSFFDSGLFRYLVGTMFRQILSNLAIAALSLNSEAQGIEFGNPEFFHTLVQLLQTKQE